MTEKDLWQLIKRYWSEAHLTRIENTVTFGVPDINVCIDGIEFWVETKIEHNDKISIRPSQLAWVISRVKANGNVFILAANDIGCFLYPGKNILNHGAIKILHNQPYLDLNELGPYILAAPIKNISQMLKQIVEYIKQESR